jgi:uncharacterized protein (TIGR02145 family)
MKINLVILILLPLTFFSCQKIERDNPFDPECPTQLWAPTNFQAAQEGNAVKLTWNVPITNISGIKVFRQINYSGNFIEITDLKEDARQWIDNDIFGGKVHLYFLVAYAGNNESNSSDAQITPKTLASVVTTAPSSITSNSAIVGGVISADGGATVTERGICYGIEPNPATNNNKSVIGNGIGSYSTKITGLFANTTYFVRAYAINSQGTAYGEQSTFTTQQRIYFNPTLSYGSLNDNDGNVYKTITIGKQTWMAENLKTTKYNDGTVIPIVTTTSSWALLKTDAYCWPNNDETTYKDTYGALYNWYAVNSGKLCPKGWHVPTDTEWTTLITYLGGESVGRGKLKETGIAHWKSPNTNATNLSGFSAVPSGYLYGTFYPIGYYASWWSSTEANQYDTKCRILDYLDSNSFYSSGTRGFGLSVRCIKD